MEALLMINSLLLGVSLYFMKDFHGDFKEMGRTVNLLKEKVAEMSARLDAKMKVVKKRLSKSSRQQSHRP